MPEPTVPVAPEQKGPWHWFQLRIIVPAFFGLVIFVLVLSHLASTFFNLSGPKQTAEQKAASKYQETTQVPANPNDISSFATRTTQAATDIGKAKPPASLTELMAGVSANPATTGTPNPLAVPGNPLNTDPRVYKAWVDADSAARNSGALPNGTVTASAPPSGGSSTGVSAAEEKREAARKRELQRLTASSIAIDFTKQTGNTKLDSATDGNSQVEPVSTERTTERTGSEKLSDLFTPASSGSSVPGGSSTDMVEPVPLKEHKCYEICEGDLIETVLTNRLDGSQAGFVDVLVTQPVFSHAWDPQGSRLLIPVGSRVLGKVTAVNGTQQRRLFVAFHKLRRPDGSTFSLDNFIGLDMAGGAGLRDQINNHYLSIFGAAGAIAAIGAVGQIGNSQSSFGYDPSVSLRNGMSQEMGQTSMKVLDRFLSQPPTMIVREGKSLIKVYFSTDVTLPAYVSRELAYAK